MVGLNHLLCNSQTCSPGVQNSHLRPYTWTPVQTKHDTLYGTVELAIHLTGRIASLTAVQQLWRVRKSPVALIPLHDLVLHRFRHLLEMIRFH